MIESNDSFVSLYVCNKSNLKTILMSRYYGGYKKLKKVDTIFDKGTNNKNITTDKVVSSLIRFSQALIIIYTSSFDTFVI